MQRRKSPFLVREFPTKDSPTRSPGGDFQQAHRVWLLDLSHNPELFRTVGRQRAIEIRIFGDDFESRQLEKVAHLLSSSPPEAPRGFFRAEAAPLLIPFFDSKVFSENLTNRIIDSFDDASNHSVAGAQVFGFPFGNWWRGSWYAVVESRIEQIYHQVATWKEAPINATQSPPLLIRKRQVMKRAERHERQSKAFAEFKRSHVHLVKADSLSGRGCFARGLLPRLREHGCGNINSHDFEARRRNRPKYAPGSRS